jgi:hypothetical protein
MCTTPSKSSTKAHDNGTVLVILTITLAVLNTVIFVNNGTFFRLINDFCQTYCIKGPTDILNNGSMSDILNNGSMSDILNNGSMSDILNNGFYVGHTE